MSTEQKTAWASKIVIVDAKTGEELDVGRISYELNEMTNASFVNFTKTHKGSDAKTARNL